jgi:hypothetical protein
MDNQKQLYDLKSAIDDLQTIVHTHSMIMIGCTWFIAGIIFISTQNNILIVGGLVIMLIGIYVIIFNVRIYRDVFANKIRRLL